MASVHGNVHDVRLRSNLLELDCLALVVTPDIITARCQDEAQRASVPHAGCNSSLMSKSEGVTCNLLCIFCMLALHKSDLSAALNYPVLRMLRPLKNPKVDLEQYPTGVELAARMLYTVRHSLQPWLPLLPWVPLLISRHVNLLCDEQNKHEV